MDITEVRIFLKHDDSNKKLKGYATITIDNAFVVRNVKIIEGNKGLFVAMPSRKVKESCPKCGFKNVVRSRFCNQCGGSLPMKGAPTDEMARQAEHKDIAHPITIQCRENIQKKVLDAYQLERSGKGAGIAPEAVSKDRPQQADSEDKPQVSSVDIALPQEDDKDLEL